MLRSLQHDAQTLGTNAICFVSPNGEVTVKQVDETSFPIKALEKITLAESRSINH